jgi:hypothetical protein
MKFIKLLILIKNRMGIGDWGLGIGDWGLGIGPNPHFVQKSLICNNI